MLDEGLFVVIDLLNIANISDANLTRTSTDDTAYRCVSSCARLIESKLAVLTIFLV